MDDRITRIERLAALHREGALTDDEFRDEKLRVLSDRAGEGDPIVAEPALPPVTARDPEPLLVDGAAPIQAEAAGIERRSEDEVADPQVRSTIRWWVTGVLVAIVALGGAIWYASSITVADAPRSSVGTAATRQLARPSEPEPVEPDPVVTDVSEALAFADAGECAFGPQGARAFDALLSQQDGEWASDGPVRLGPLTLTPRLEVERQEGDNGLGSVRYQSSARAPDGVLWNDLKLSRLVHSLNLPDGTDSLEERSITFLEEPDRVQRILRRLGVSVPMGDDYREIDGGACGGSMQIKAIPGGSALVCQWGC